MREMKYRGFTIFCLIIMTCYIARPFLPFIEYVIHKEYIAKNLCVYKDVPNNSCHGQCYLHKQLQKAQQESPVNPNNSKDKSQNNKVDDHLRAIEISTVPFEIKSDEFYITEFPLVVVFKDAVFVPPKNKPETV
jgi:hypothetical protein